MPTGRFSPKTKPVFPVAQHSERLQRTIRAYKELNFTYDLNHKKDRAEVLLDLYAQKDNFRPFIKSRLMTFCRCKISEPNMFELDDNGTLDSENKVKQALVYSESIRIMSPENPVTETLVQATILHNVYSRPFATMVFDEWGNPTDKSRITSHRNVFWKPFTEKNVNDVLERFGGKYRNLTLAYANPGSESWYTLPTYTVTNLHDFIHEDFDDLIAANMGGFLRGDYEGGVQLYLKDKADKKKKMQDDLTEFKKTGRGGR